MENEKRAGFTSSFGAVAAAAGSAIGLGNIWRFPYTVGQYGGGAFLLIYIIFVFLLGVPLIMSEFIMGRRSGRNVLGAFRTLAPQRKAWQSVGWLAILSSCLIFSFYSVVAGWTFNYIILAGAGKFEGQSSEAIAQIFSNFTTNTWSPIFYLGLFIFFTALVVVKGVQKGIEKICKVLMPLLFILIIVIAVYSLTLPGALDGAAYYLLPDFSDFDAEKLFKTVAAASSQLFYSTSIAMGINVTYGSYMRKEDSLESSVRHVELFDTGAAFLSGLIIVPSVFVFSGGDKEALGSGPSLMFITLPKVFETMPAGNIIGAAFFVLVSLAALTSAISLMETVVAAVMEKFNLSRTISCVIVFIITIALGMLSVLGYSSWSDVTLLGMRFLDFFDFITNSVMMPILALLTCILIGYVVKTKYIEDEVLSCGGRFRTRRIYRVMIKFICPVCMIIILLTPFFTDI